MEPHLFEPKGELTLELVHDLVVALDKETATGSPMVVTLRSITGVRWSALCQLAAAFHLRRTACDLRLRDVAPRLGTLFREVGICA